MAFTHTLVEKLTIGGTSITKSNSFTAGAKQSVEESIANNTTDGLVAFNLDFSQCKSFLMVSDQDITVETNSGNAADDTFSLTAGVPYIWHENSNHTFLVGTDITALYVTNASGAAATLQIEALYDPTV